MTRVDVCMYVMIQAHVAAEACAGHDAANNNSVCTRVYVKLSEPFKLKQLDKTVLYTTKNLTKLNDNGEKRVEGRYSRVKPVGLPKNVRLDSILGKIPET